MGSELRPPLDASLIAVYVVLYAAVGFGMNAFGRVARIAEFRHWWQVLTCYVLYLVPVSMAVREMPLWDQYLRGLLALGVLELVGYALGTSIAHPGNWFDRVFGERNFALAMTLAFALVLPAGNVVTQAIHSLLG